MNNIVLSIILTLFFVISEAIAFNIISNSVLDFRFTKHPVIGMTCAILLTALVGAPLSDFVGNTILKGIVFVVAYVCITFIFYRGPSFIRFYIATLTYVLIITFDSIAVIAVAILQENLSTVINDTNIYILCAVITKVVLILFSVILYFNFRRHRISYLSNKIPLLMPLFLMIIDVVVVIQLTSDPYANKWVAILTAISLVLLNLVVYFLMDVISRKAENEKENALFKQQVDMQLNHAKTTKNVYDEQRQLMHDYRNQLTVIRQLLTVKKTDEALAYLDSISSGVVVANYNIHTNNEIIDAILNNKEREARARDIKFEVLTGNLSDITLNDRDLVCIMTNVIDNAIEACEHIAFKERQINVKLSSDQGTFTVVVINTVQQKIPLQSKTPETTKDDLNVHGLGLKNVAEVLRKYNADYELFCDDQCFKFVTMIKY